jgi:hypothetical protein
VQKAALAEMPANLRRAWVEAGTAARNQIERNAVTLKRANEQGAERAVESVGDIINKAIPDKADPVGIEADARSAFTTIDGVKSALRAIPDEEVVIRMRTEASPESIPEFLARMEMDLTRITDADWEIGVGMHAPALDGLDDNGGGLAGAGVGAGTGGGNLAVVLDRRRFTETTDYDARYRGF